MTSRELVKRAIKFESPERIPFTLPGDYGDDTAWVRMAPYVDERPPTGPDEWGAVWENIGVSKMGEVKEFPLLDWADFDKLTIPDVTRADRWENMAGVREYAGDRFLGASGVSLYERTHFIRGLENVWCDIYENPDQLGRLIDILVDMNLYAIKQYAQAGVDGYMWWDDWGLQDRTMISPDAFREIWKPRYARVYQAAHDAGMLTFLHSCGHIVDILDDLIEAGLDVIQMDQQTNMGLDLLSERFRGRITFWCPVDIQSVMPHGSDDEIRAYVREMATKLGSPEGGFIGKWYGDPVGAGHSEHSVKVMCEEFVKLSTQNLWE